MNEEPAKEEPAKECPSRAEKWGLVFLLLLGATCFFDTWNLFMPSPGWDWRYSVLASEARMGLIMFAVLFWVFSSLLKRKPAPEKEKSS